MTGFHLFLKRTYSESQHQSQDITEHWFAKRRRVSADALRQWRSNTYEMVRLRRELSEEAKAINARSNFQRQLSIMSMETQSSSVQEVEETVASHQTRLFDAAMSSGLLGSEHTDAALPSLCKPKALANFALRHHASDLPMPTDGRLDIVPVDTDTSVPSGGDIQTTPNNQPLLVSISTI